MAALTAPSATAEIATHSVNVEESQGPERLLSHAKSPGKQSKENSDDRAFASRGSSSEAVAAANGGRLFEATAQQKRKAVGTVKITFEYIIERRDTAGAL